MNQNERTAHGTRGYLLKTFTDDSFIFRVYDPKDRKKFKDYQIFHHDLEIEILDNYSSFYDTEEEGSDYNGYIDYPSRLTKNVQ